MAKQIKHTKKILTNQPSSPGNDNEEGEKSKPSSITDKNGFEKAISVIRSRLAGRGKEVDIDRFMRRLRFDSELNHVDIVQYAHDNPDTTADYILSIMPPPGAIYVDETPIPPAFRQRHIIYIDKIMGEVVASIKDDPLGWWQPLGDPYISYALNPLVEFIKAYNPDLISYSIGSLNTNVPVQF